MKILEGYKELNAGDKIQEGDLFSGPFQLWHRCHDSIGFLYKVKNGHFDDDVVVIRKIQKEQEEKSKFQVGEIVSFTEEANVEKLLGTKGLTGEILRVVGCARNGVGHCYVINCYVRNLPIAVCLRDEFLNKVEYIAGHTAVVRGDGLQIGCTFVSDEDIKKAAKLRNII
jgi:hypothetical protein